MGWSRPVIRRLMDRYPGIVQNSLVLLHDRYQELQTRIRELSTETVERRIANALLRLTQHAGRRTAVGIEIVFPLSRQDMAEMTGTTLHTVSRTVSLWETDGIVEGGRRRMVVRDPQRLAQVIADTGHE
jgi:CRP-like cAMP-binding protein